MAAPVTTSPKSGPLWPLVGRASELADQLVDAGEVTAPAPVQPFIVSVLAHQRPLLVVTATLRDAEALVDDVAAYTGQDHVALFPPWETLPLERLSPQPSTVGQRLRVLDRLRPDSDDELRVVVAPVRALLQPMDPRLGERRPIVVDASYSGGLDGLVEGLAALGYTRTPLVTARGEFAVRGGLVDVFPTAADHPVRVEFFGDDVDEIRVFAAADQRAIETVDRLVVDAARELVLDAETADTAEKVIAVRPALADQLQMLVDGVAFEGMEALVTAIHPAPAYLPDFMPPRSGLVVTDPIRVADRAAELESQSRELMVAGWAGEDGVTGFAEWDRVILRAAVGPWELTPFASAATLVRVAARGWDSFRGDIVQAAHAAGGLTREHASVVLTAAGHGTALRIAEVLRDEGVVAEVAAEVPLSGDGRVVIVESPLRHGFVSRELGVAVLGEFDLFGPRRSRASRRLPSRRTAAEGVLDLEEGDPVVHSTHGVGRYLGMQTRELAGATTAGGSTTGAVTRDYVVVEYAGGDRLFVPSDQIDALSAYVGGEQPKIMKMGGAEWERARSKVKAHVQEVAAELIRLYQARMHAPGVAHPPDGDWLGELEQAFPYVETPDQLEAIDEVKADLEVPLPMDRLICGDVGFGKTEIAVRAAAKVVFGGRQVAVLVPTTLLAQQHTETFTERFAGFPVQIRSLSRFASKRQQAEILDGLAAGTVDLVIGTHRLLGKDVTFKDLGLVIVDEEQRFGVTHKEKLKQLKTSVDVLTMSATPIPRTLEMAITGIRDLSTIETPPEERQPVVTQVQQWDEGLAALAARRELLREGQVFWVHNAVSTIDAAAERVRELVAGARVRVGHGQMPEAELERVMVDFYHREFDILVCTTIIESGLDVPNVNTLVVERADLLGLAQLYQLRGRVGRSHTRGYAYLFYPEDAALTEEAYRRLESIAEHTALGSGMSVALKDLQIRGAGDLLSPEQSGHIAGVGFEAYAQLMAEAVTELTQGKPAEREAEVTVDLPVDAHLPRSYIDDEALRLQAYRKIAAVRDAAGAKRVREELIDRYGPLPETAERLLAVAALKAALRRWSITDVKVTPRRTVRVEPVHLSESAQVRLRRMHPDGHYQPGVLELPLPGRKHDVVGWLARELAGLLARPAAGAGSPRPPQ